MTAHRTPAVRAGNGSMVRVERLLALDDRRINMAMLHKPAVEVPEHVVTQEQTLELCRRLHADHPRLALALRLIENTGVKKRHIVRPIEEILEHPGFEVRNEIYKEEAKRRIPPVVRSALENARLAPAEIDLIIFVSCTGFTMPSLTAWMINNLGFRYETTQLPIAQLGCAAGGAAINRAHDFCIAYPDANVLIVACEFCSLCYQPTDTAIGNLLSNGLFGDAVAAAVVSGRPRGTGMCLERNASYLTPGTEEWIRYDVKATGFHFMLDKRVPSTMVRKAGAIQRLVDRHGWDASGLDFYVVHAGGPRILLDFSTAVDADMSRLRESWETLTAYGNIASAVVLESYRRLYENESVVEGARGLIAGFGPGVTAEISLGTWTTTDAAGGTRGVEETLTV